LLVSAQQGLCVVRPEDLRYVRLGEHE
jgi:hypothetical protein